MINHWTPAELKTLRRLREGFLNRTAGQANYWREPEDLALYDTTFAERIGWKWDAVLRELGARGWKPESRKVVDWGCGTGIASRRVLAEWPQFSSLTLHDRTPAAARFAAERARRDHPEIKAGTGEAVDAGTLLVLSHVLNELPPRELSRLLDLVRQAGEVIWVEAGAREESRKLSEVRDALLARGPGFVAVAPCTHQATCGMLVPRNEQHWCHHFARPPSAVFQDARWHQFSLELGIDLRSLPFSFLVLQRPRESVPTPAGFSRVIGKPREYKGYDKVLSCHEGGVGELMLQKRDAPELLREVREGGDAPVYRWSLRDGKIVGGEQLPGL